MTRHFQVQNGLDHITVTSLKDQLTTVTFIYRMGLTPLNPFSG